MSVSSSSSSRFQAFTKALNYDSSESWNYGPVCNIDHNPTKYFGVQVNGLAEKLFLSSCDLAVKGERSYEFKICLGTPIEKIQLLAAVLLFKSANIETYYGQEYDRFPINFPSFTHSLICKESSLDIKISWKSDNPYLNPKPLLLVEPVTAWGMEKLLENRRNGTDTDLIPVEFANHVQRAHPYVLKAFSEYFEAALRFKSEKLVLKKIDLSETMSLSFIEYMYQKPIEFATHSHREAIKLLPLAQELCAKQLTNVTLEYIYSVAETLNSHDILLLLVCGAAIQTPQLQTLTSWVLRYKPEFYKDVFEGAVDPEDFLMLLKVSHSYKIEGIKPLWDTAWKELETEQKIQFMNQSFSNADTDTFFLMEDKARMVSESLEKDDPFRDAFFDSYDKLSAQVIKERRAGRKLS